MRFNQKTKTMESVEKVANYEGAVAYDLADEMKLYTHVCTSLVSDQFYASAGEGLKKTEDLVKKCHPQFVANLASYARNEMNLRTIPVVLCAFLARHHGGSIATEAIVRSVKRADEITELLSFYYSINTQNRKPITKGNHVGHKNVKVSRSLLRGLKKVFESGRFDEYRYAKYSRDTAVKMKDVLFLTHPKAQTPEQAALFAKIANNNLDVPYTWEVELSRVGQEFAGKGENAKNDAKLAKWQEMVSSNRLPYMALLRNLANIFSLHPSAELRDEICHKLVQGAATGKQFPFRYWSAYKNLKDPVQREGKDKKWLNVLHVEQLTAALDDALRASVRSLPEFLLKGRTLIACDTSGSMKNPISKKSSIQQIEIGVVLGTLIKAEVPETTLGVFGTKWGVHEGKIVQGSVLKTIEKVVAMNVGWSTNGHVVADWLVEQNKAVDNVLMFTDCQLWDSCQEGGSLKASWQRYLDNVNKDARIFLFDLTGYGNTPLKITKNNVLVAGWSDRVFEAVDYLSRGQSATQMIRDYHG